MSDEITELQKISRVLTLAYAEAIEREIAKHATTNSRKKIWVLVDGTNMPKDIVRIIGKIEQGAVETFLSQLEKAKLIENPSRFARKPPSKLVDYVPPKWIELLEGAKVEEGKEEENK